MIVEGIAVEFDKHIFDTFYTEDHQWPPEVELYSKDEGRPLSCIKRIGSSYLAVELRWESDTIHTRQLEEKDIMMVVPRYLIDIFYNLKIIEGLPITDRKSVV